MKLRILKLDYIVFYGPNFAILDEYGLEIKIEELYNACDIIQLNYINRFGMREIKQILENQNYCYYPNIFGYNSDYCDYYFNNEFKKNIIFITRQDVRIYDEYDEYDVKLSDCINRHIKDNLPCFVNCD